MTITAILLGITTGLTIILGATNVLLACKLVKYKLSADALVYYMKTKQYTPPTQEEAEECAKHVSHKMFK